jgi:hypothetical protein
MGLFVDGSTASAKLKPHKKFMVLRNYRYNNF